MSEAFEIPSPSGVLRGTITHSLHVTKGSVICLHGNPNGDLRGNENIFGQLAERLAPIGYTVIQFSLNGSPPSDGTQAATCLRTQCDDYEAVIGYVRQRFIGPVHVVGESAGATIASLRWRDDIASYVLLWPAFDLSKSDLGPYLKQPWLDLAKRDGYIQDQTVTLGSELISELLSIDFSSSYVLPPVPVLIVHGQADEEVPYQQSLNAIFKATGPFQFCSVPDAGHGFKAPAHRLLVLRVVTRWFEDYETSASLC